MPGPDATLRYDRDVLYVGEVALPQFPGYVNDELQRDRMPVGWPIASELIMSHSAGYGPPIVRAAIFRPGAPNSADAKTLVKMVDDTMGKSFAAGRVVAEDTITAPDRTCYFRVRSGLLDEAEPDLVSLSGTVIATSTTRPNVGVVIDALPDQPIERLTREIAAALCRPA